MHPTSPGVLTNIHSDDVFRHDWRGRWHGRGEKCWSEEKRSSSLWSNVTLSLCAPMRCGPEPQLHLFQQHIQYYAAPFGISTEP
jgi:hypothetical protein